MTGDELPILRRAFARQMMAVAGIAGDARLEAAFGKVAREDFLGTDPWFITDIAKGLLKLPSNDPVYAYQDVLFSLSPNRGVNNGAPSLHARLLHALAPQPDQRVLHLGAGTGYYSAILAELVGPKGHVTAVELDPVLADMARDNLADRPNVDVVVDDGGNWPRAAVDRIYVNFAVTAPAAAWIDQLARNGRMVLPLGVPGEPRRPAGPRFSRHGGAFVIECRQGGFAASYIGPAYFIHGEGAVGGSGDGACDRLQRAFRSGGMEFVRSLVWQQPTDANRCWFWSGDWSLSYDPV